MTPYDWQEAIGHRTSYVENRLAGGSPALALSVDEGILLLTVRRQTRKIYEIYDRLAFAGLGLQSDIESLRVAAIDFTHQEGYQRSEDDVTVQRVISALSTPLKRAFGDLNSAPFIVRALFAQVGDAPQDDLYYLLDFDGDYTTRTKWAVLSGDVELSEDARGKLHGAAEKPVNLKSGQKLLEEVWVSLSETTDGESFAELTKDLSPELALLSRDPRKASRFRLLG